MMNSTIFYCKMAILPTILIEGFCRAFCRKSSPPEARIPCLPDKSNFEVWAEQLRLEFSGG
jgi:hypothetical protein